MSSAATTQLGLRRGLHDFPGWLVPRNPGLEDAIPSGLTVSGNQPLIKRAVGDTNFSEEPKLAVPKRGSKLNEPLMFANTGPSVQRLLCDEGNTT